MSTGRFRMELKYFLMRLLYALVISIGLILNFNEHYFFGYVLLALGLVLLFIFTHFEVKARKEFKKLIGKV